MKKTQYFMAYGATTDPQKVADKAMQLRDAFLKDNGATILSVEDESISVISVGGYRDYLVATVTLCYLPR